MKSVFEVYGSYNGEPAGFVGRYHKEKDAQGAASRSQVSCNVKKVRLGEKDYKLWEDSGFKPNGWAKVDEDGNLVPSK